MARRDRKTRVGKRYHKPGTAPGTLRGPETADARPARVTLIDYSPDHVEEKKISRIEEVFPYRDSPTVTWINVEGLADVGLIERIGRHFGFHPLALEDVLNCGQRPKLEDYGSYHFLVLKSLYRKEGELEIEQISFFLAGNYVVTFQEVPGDSFEAVRERIRHGKGQIRRMGPDYLVYALMDALVDEFFPVLEIVRRADRGAGGRGGAARRARDAQRDPSHQARAADAAAHRLAGAGGDQRAAAGGGPSHPARRPGSSCATATITSSR